MPKVSRLFGATAFGGVILVSILVHSYLGKNNAGSKKVTVPKESFPPLAGRADVDQNTSGQAQVITRDRAIAIVTQEYKRRGRLSGASLKGVEIDAAPLDDGGWIIDVWYLPARPGKFTIIKVKADGNIAEFLDGDA
jgi:hypothetical protein